MALAYTGVVTSQHSTMSPRVDCTKFTTSSRSARGMVKVDPTVVGRETPVLVDTVIDAEQKVPYTCVRDLTLRNYKLVQSWFDEDKSAFRWGGRSETTDGLP